MRQGKGEAPTKESKLAWEKLRRDNMNRLASRTNKWHVTDMEEERNPNYKSPSGTQTATDPRPIAYIQDSYVDLPISRPYEA